MAKCVVNEVLCFVTGQSDKLDPANIHSVIHDFYTLEELRTAKLLLIREGDNDGLSDLITDENRKSRKKPNPEQKVAKDILDIWRVIDRERGGQLPCIFVAADINRLPSVKAENFSLQFLVTSILKLQQQSEEQTNAISFLSNSVSHVYRRLENSSVTAPRPLASTSFYTPSFPSRRQCPPVPTPPPINGVVNPDSNLNLRRSVLRAKRKSLDADIPSFVPQKQKKLDFQTSSPVDEVFEASRTAASTSETVVETFLAPEASEASVGASEASVEASEASVEASEASVEASEASVGASEASVEASDASVEASESEASVEASYASVEALEASVKASYASVEASAQASEASVKEPESSVKAPVSSTEAPEICFIAPETSVKVPGNTVQAPETPFEVPETSAGAPETPIEAPETSVASEATSAATVAEPEFLATVPDSSVSADTVGKTLEAARAVGEASKLHTNTLISSAVKSAKKAAKAAKAAAKAAEASKAIASVKESTAVTKKAEAVAAAAAAKALREAAASSSSGITFASIAKDPQPALQVSSSSATSTSSSTSSSSSSASVVPVPPTGISPQLESNRKTTKTIVGNREGGVLQGVAPRVRNTWDLFVSNLSENSTDFQLKTYLQGHDIEVRDVWLLNSKKKGTKSAKVRIAVEHRNKVKERNVWPKHIRVQDWVRKPKPDV